MVRRHRSSASLRKPSSWCKLNSIQFNSIAASTAASCQQPTSGRRLFITNSARCARQARARDSSQVFARSTLAARRSPLASKRANHLAGRYAPPPSRRVVRRATCAQKSRSLPARACQRAHCAAKSRSAHWRSPLSYVTSRLGLRRRLLCGCKQTNRQTDKQARVSVAGYLPAQAGRRTCHAPACWRGSSLSLARQLHLARRYTRQCQDVELSARAAAAARVARGAKSAAPLYLFALFAFVARHTKLRRGVARRRQAARRAAAAATARRRRCCCQDAAAAAKTQRQRQRQRPPRTPLGVT